MQGRGVSLVYIVLMCAPAWAGERETYHVRGGAALPEETRLVLAAAGKPSWHTAPAEGSTLRKLLNSVCGSQEPQAEKALEALTLKLNGGDTIDRAIPGGVGVALPFCVKVERNVKVRVAEGDTLEGLLRKHYGLAGPVTLAQTYELNNTDRRWSSVDDFSQSLRPGQVVTLPYAAAESVFTPADSALDLGFTSQAELNRAARVPESALRREAVTEAGAPESAVASLPPALRGVLEPARPWWENADGPSRLSPGFGFESAPVAAPSPRDFEYVRFVSNEPGGPQWCASPDAGPPFDLDLLKQRFAVEAEAAATFDPFLVPPVVGIIDTGLAVDTGVFTSPLLHVNRREQQGRDGQDDDHPTNGFIDDLYGINFNGGPESGSVLYYEADPHFEHGTKIGTLVLGGSAWAQGWQGSRPWIRLKVINFSSSSEPHPVDAIHLATAVNYLLALDARVVNLSLQNHERLDPVSQAMLRSRRTLFVAAAGNTSSGGEDLGVDKVYPAAQGGDAGDLATVLITVGAHARDGSWAGFSNYSNRYVDLLAPGCSIATLDAQGAAVKESGTSVATAIVSFAAGLLGSLGETDVRNLKNRLLVSVDVDPALATRARTSGRLNVVKAVSLSTDVIEVLDRSQPYSFGHLSDRDLLRGFCGDGTKRTKLGAMRKVRPNIAGAQGDTRVHYWIESDGELATIDCPQVDATQSVGPLEVEGQTVAGPALKDVRDIVLADR